MSLLIVDDLSKAYGDFWAVSHVSFKLEAGKMLALIGPNGAGKTTTFNMIGGQTDANNGSVKFKGIELLNLSAQKIWSLGIGRTFQIAATFSSLSVVENVQLALQSHAGLLHRLTVDAPTALRDEAMALLAQVGMQEQADRPASEIAYGDVKRLELAVALAHKPELLLMDEPTAGMSPKERVQMMALTRELATQRNMAVLFTEHSMDVVFAFADQIIVMAAGSLIAQGTPEEIKHNPAVREVYLGSTPLAGERAAVEREAANMDAEKDADQATIGQAALKQPSGEGV